MSGRHSLFSEGFLTLAKWRVTHCPIAQLVLHVQPRAQHDGGSADQDSQRRELGGEG